MKRFSFFGFASYFNLYLFFDKMNNNKNIVMIWWDWLICKARHIIFIIKIPLIYRKKQHIMSLFFFAIYLSICINIFESILSYTTNSFIETDKHLKWNEFFFKLLKTLLKKEILSFRLCCLSWLFVWLSPEVIFYILVDYINEASFILEWCLMRCESHVQKKIALWF